MTYRLKAPYWYHVATIVDPTTKPRYLSSLVIAAVLIALGLHWITGTALDPVLPAALPILAAAWFGRPILALSMGVVFLIAQPTLAILAGRSIQPEFLNALFDGAALLVLSGLIYAVGAQIRSLRQASGDAETAPDADVVMDVAIGERPGEVDQSVRVHAEAEVTQVLLEAHHDGVVYNDLAGRIMLVNTRFAAMFGFNDANQVLSSGLTTFELLAPDSRETARERAAPLFETDMIREVEMQVQRRDGTIFDAEFNTTIIRDRQGEPTMMITFVRDISERKRFITELQRSEERLRLAQQVAKMGTFDLDLQTNTNLWTVEMEALHGLGPGEFAGTYEAWEQLVHPEDLLLAKQLVSEAHQSGSPVNGEWRVRWPDGSIHWLAARYQAFFDPDGNPARLIGVNLDITAQKAAEAEQRQLEAKFQQVQKLESLGVLAGGIAHDFNNYLTSILGYADLALVELTPNAPAAGFIAEAVNGARRASDLTKQLLAYSGKGRFVEESLNLSQLVEGMSRLLEISISKKCVVHYNLTPDLPSIFADATQLRQVVMNLIINASEAIGERSGVLTITTGAMYCDRDYLFETYLDEDLPEGLYVYLEVADNGIGMMPDTRQRVFEPFFTTKQSGRGLGLAAVLGIVRGHRGALKIYSEHKIGTTIKALFPAVDLPAHESAGQVVADVVWQGSGTALVVDDEETIRRLARRMLERMGFTVLMASDGREGVEIFRLYADEVRVVLLDMTMPHLDGEATFRELRRIRSGVHVILSSGYNEQSATSQFVGKGLAAFIQKPYRFEELRTVVRAVLTPPAS